MTDVERRDEPAGPDADDDGGFISRWSRRKQRAGRPPEAAAPEPAEPTAAPEPVRALGDEDMPPLESIEQSRDVSPFLSEGVSEGLRRRALRRLFSLPGFNVRDGLDDYDEDYRSFAALGDIVTSDMKFDRERLERLAREQAQPREPEIAQSLEGETSVEKQPVPDAGSGVEPDDAEESV